MTTVKEGQGVRRESRIQGAVCFLICNEEIVLLSTRGAGGLLIRVGLGRGDWVDRLGGAATGCYSGVNRSAGLSRWLGADSFPTPPFSRQKRRDRMGTPGFMRDKGQVSVGDEKDRSCRELHGVLGPLQRAPGAGHEAQNTWHREPEMERTREWRVLSGSGFVFSLGCGVGQCKRKERCSET